MGRPVLEWRWNTKDYDARMRRKTKRTVKDAMTRALMSPSRWAREYEQTPKPEPDYDLADDAMRYARMQPVEDEPYAGEPVEEEPAPQNGNRFSGLDFT